MLLNSTEHVLSVLHTLLHLITKIMYDEGVLNIPILQMRKLKHRDITVLTTYGNTCFLVSVFIYLVNCVGKALYGQIFGEKIRFKFSVLKTKLSELHRLSKQCPGSSACTTSFNQKENLRVKGYENYYSIYEETEAQRL